MGGSRVLEYGHVGRQLSSVNSRKRQVVEGSWLVGKRSFEEEREREKKSQKGEDGKEEEEEVDDEGKEEEIQPPDSNLSGSLFKKIYIYFFSEMYRK